MDSFQTAAGLVVPAVTAEQMREVDRVAIEEVGPNLYQMMENAGRNLASMCVEILGEAWASSPIVVLAGTGGNGGGGICAARHLANHGGRVTLVVSNADGLAGVPAEQFALYRTTDGRLAEARELVGRGEHVPLGPEDLQVLATTLQPRVIAPGGVLFAAGSGPAGVWLIQSGHVELSVGSGRKRAVLAVLHEGDVDGDIPMLLKMPPPYTARALDAVQCLFVSPDAFELLLASRGQLARRWLTSVAARLANSQNRLVGLLGGSLTAQTARLLVDEADATGHIALSQATLAAMLGAQRPSVNKVLGELAAAGLIEVSYRNIRVVDVDRLAKVT